MVTIKSKDDNDNSPEIELWITDKIESKGDVQQGLSNKEIGGFPLEYTIHIKGQFSMTTKATEFKKDFDKSVFNFNKTGYKDMSIEQLKNLGGGGGL